MAPPLLAAWIQAGVTFVSLVQGHATRGSTLRTSEGCFALRNELTWRRLVPPSCCLARFPPVGRPASVDSTSSCLGHRRCRPRVTPCVLPPPLGGGSSTIRRRASLLRPSPSLPPPGPGVFGGAISALVLATPSCSRLPAVCPVGRCVGVVAASSPALAVGEDRAVAPRGLRPRRPRFFFI